MIAGFLIHLVTYVAVCAMLVAIWFLGPEGSVSTLQGYYEDPDAIEASFWPIWVIVTWGAAVVIHLGVVLATGAFGRRRRAERHRYKEAMVAHARRAAEAASGVAETAVHEVQRRRSAGSGARPAGRRSASPERRWVTVMFTDIVNSTQLTEALGDDQWSRLLREHRDLVRAAFAERGGDEVNTVGDGFLARFDTPGEAVLCGVDIQRALQQRRDAGGVVPSVRIGIHAGEAVEDDGDLVGRVVNLASRVAAEAEPDEILVTEPVADYVGQHLSLVDRGVRVLKGVAQPRHLLSVRWDEAGVVAGAPASGDDATDPSPG